MIMERKLLAPDGIILVDDGTIIANHLTLVLASGCTADASAGNPQDVCVRNGVELRKFNDHIAKVIQFHSI
jgi:hypothetical protein